MIAPAEVEVRRLQRKDVDAVARMARAAAQDDGAASTSLDADHIRRFAFRMRAPFEVFACEAVRGGPLIGHAIITKGYDIRRAVATVVLAELYVAPEHRRGGVARALMRAVAKRASDLGARELMITTGLENAVARKFFSAIGAAEQQAAVFMMTQDGIQWLAAEGR